MNKFISKGSIILTVSFLLAMMLSFSAFAAKYPYGKLTCEKGKKIWAGKIIEVKLNKRAAKRTWEWSFSGTAAKDARFLSLDYQTQRRISFTVWPSGGTLKLTGKDAQGHKISISFKVRQGKKWKKREQYRLDALAGMEEGMTKIQSVVYFVNYIADHATNGAGQGNFFRVIDEGVGDCWCYATAFKMLADSVGIETIIVKNGGTRSHYWNQVKINDTWYNVDANSFDVCRTRRCILSSDARFKWWGDQNYSAQFSIHYPVSPANVCNSDLRYWRKKVALSA